MHHSTPPPNLHQLLAELGIGDELFWEPIRLARPGAWSGHLATAFWLTKILEPHILVELGTHSGNSYSAFCQAISLLGLSSRAFAVDTWQGDEHSGSYDESVFRDFNAFNESHFAAFSKLLRTTFNDARNYFQDGTIDLLHIDGLHSYEAVKHDFDTWKGALSDRAVVMFHDTNVREKDFGVWKLWQELAGSYPSFEFHHSEGLGILGVGRDQPQLLRRLFELNSDPQSAAIVRRVFAARGEAFRGRSQVLDLENHANNLQIHLSNLQAHISDLSGKLREQSEQLSAHAGLLRSLEHQLVNRDAVIVERQSQLQAKTDLADGLQQQLIEREYSLRTREEELRLANQAIQQKEQLLGQKDQLLSTKQREIAQANETAGQLRQQLAQSASAFDEERTVASAHVEKLTRELSNVKQQLGLIENSSAWKAVSRIRNSFQNYPRFRHFARRAARVIWWTVTFQLFARLRDRRQLLQMRDLIARSTLFDASWYTEHYPEIAEFGDPALHYALFGAKERRNPSPHFDVQNYLKRYPDVAEYGMNPLVHYLEHGAKEGRVVAPVGATHQVVEEPVEPPKRDYQSWVTSYDTLTDDDRAAIKRHIGILHEQPLFSIVMPVYNTHPAYLRKALDSVLSQLYPYWELCIADDASSDPEIRKILEDYARRDRRIRVVFRNENGHISAASNSALALARGSFIALMDHDDELSEHALYMVAVELNDHPETDVVYSDEDRLDENGTRSDPHFKPEWNLNLFYSYNVINHLGVYRASLARQLGGFREGFEGSQDYDLALRALDASSSDRIRHIPHVLYHWRIIPSTFSSSSLQTAVEAGRRALAEHFERRGESVTLVEGRKPYITRVIRPLPEPAPLVSLIVPTRDRVELLRDCVDGLLNRTSYQNIEVVLVDNDSIEPDTLAFFDSLRSNLRVRILQIGGPFNFSALNNAAVNAAAGDIVGFINNDIDVIHADWLAEMVGQLTAPGVGAVGAKLLYPDGTVQHAGVIVGLGGVAGHSHKYFSGSDFGYFCRLQLSYNVSCVTAACMLVHKKAFEEVGGFDEVNLTVAFNDVDLCLKIREAGYGIIWTPYAELYHRESASRGSDEVPEKLERATQEQDYMKKRWGDLLLNDPFYSPNLTLDYENYSIAFPPRTVKPWRVAALTESSLATQR